MLESAATSHISKGRWSLNVLTLNGNKISCNGIFSLTKGNWK